MPLGHQQSLRRPDCPLLCRCLCPARGVARLANVYDPGDLNFTRLVPDTMRSAYARRPLVLRSDGTIRRDYLYVADAVRAYLVLAERLTRHPEGVTGTAFDSGRGRPVAVLDLVAAVRRRFPGTPEPRIGHPAAGEIPRQYLDSSRAKRLLEWQLAHGLDEGLAATAHWYSALSDSPPDLPK